MSLTTDPNDPRLKEAQKNVTGQHDIYLVLSDEERAKGFVRPYRDSYIHQGRKVETGEIIPLEIAVADMSDYCKTNYTKENGYAAFLKYPADRSPLTGKFLTQDEVDAMRDRKEYAGGCWTVTKMGGCNKHLPVGEFVWKGTNELVGS